MENNKIHITHLSCYEILISEGRIYLTFDLTCEEEEKLRESAKSIDVFTYHPDTLGLSLTDGSNTLLVFSDFPSDLLMDSPLMLFSCVNKKGDLSLSGAAIDALESERLSEKVLSFIEEQKG